MHIGQPNERQDVWKKIAIGQTQTWIWWSKEIKFDSKIQVVSQMFGVLVTSLQNHLYRITQSRKKGKLGVLQKKEEGVFCGVCDNDVGNGALGYAQAIKTKSCWDYTREANTLQEWYSIMGVAKMVQRA